MPRMFDSRSSVSRGRLAFSGWRRHASRADHPYNPRPTSPPLPMLKNALVYRIVQWEQPALAAIEERLAAAHFVECTAAQAESAGWVAPRGERQGPMLETVAGQW